MADTDSTEPIPTIPLNQFQNDYFKTLNDFRRKNMFCDVTLQVDGKNFPCHRLVLTTASTYFQTMFHGNFKESESNTIAIEQIDAEAMDLILNAIYTAQIQLTPENAYFMLKASHFLQLNGIFNTCVAYIVANPCIHYLIDTCLFAKITAQNDLYHACAQAIANNLVCFAKTNVFELIPFEILDSILSKGNFALKADEVLLSVMKWTKSNTCTAKQIQNLTESSKFQSPGVLALLLSEVKNTLVNDEPLILRSPENYGQSNSDFILNLYVKIVDVKTGAMGWSSLEVNESFNRTSLSNFYAISSFSFRVCKIESDFYCFEFSNYAQKYDLSTYVNNKKIILTFPKEIPFCDTFEITKMDNLILFLNKNPTSPAIWSYDCKQKVWKTMFEQSTAYVRKAALHDYSDWHTAIALKSVLYVIGGRYVITNSRCILAFDIRTPSTRKIIEFPSLFEYKYATVCSFDGKLAISGSNYGGVNRNAFYIYDVNANKWLPDIKPMNNGRSNHKLIYANGFVYAVGNSPLVANEKYNIYSNTWTDLPSFPKQLSVKNSVDKVVSIEKVLYAEAYPSL